MAETINFKVRARLLEQMGEQLIKSESIALMELIKNSYDADASTCKIEMGNIDDSEQGSIIITDDGTGMNYDILKDVWLEIGTSNKADKKKTEKIERSKKFNRVPLGEKGIGRFGVHRLGREIEIITRMKNDDECRLFINWDAITKSRYIEEFPIALEKKKTETFKGNTTGTKITIRRLRSQWDRKTIRECARAVTSLNSPFDDESAFRPEFIVHELDWLDNILKYEDIEKYKLYSFEAKLDGGFITEFEYQFTPYRLMKRIEPRHAGIRDLRQKLRHKLEKKENGELIPVDLSKAKIGPVIFKGIIFGFEPRVLELAEVDDKKGLKDYLSLNGGVRIFRDKLRIWDYGEPEDDWLEMEMRRINEPGLRISKRLLLGAVYLESEKSTDLIEKANREGFMNNTAYQLLKDACRSTLRSIEIYRMEDKNKLRIIYGPQAKTVPVISSLEEAKVIINKNVSNKETVKEINRCLDRIQVNYDNITGNLMKSAGAGLNLVVVVHQMEKIIKNISAGIKKRMPIEQISEMVDELATLVEGYSILVRKSDIKTRNLKDILEKTLFNLEFRFDYHKINLEPAFRNRLDHLDGICSESHVVNAVMNLVDNSIWWMNYAKMDEKSILIDISSEYKGYSTILVADTGPGITIDRSLLGQPFVTAKPEGEGMGIGLHLTTLIMESLGGKILYPDFDDFSLPKKYKAGAIIALAFKEK
jgi:anti-sigma regulatory factor (Ser/Thr protein kinase)